MHGPINMRYMTTFKYLILMTNIPQEYSLSVVVFSECYQSYIILLSLVADLVKRHLSSYGFVSIALSILYLKSVRFVTPIKYVTPFYEMHRVVVC